MDTDYIEKYSAKHLKELIARLGGWPVVEGKRWSGDNFTWWNLSVQAASEGLDTDQIIGIGNYIYHNWEFYH